MTDLVLRDIDPVLAERMRKVAHTNGWTMHQAIMHLIERGLYASEGGVLRFDSSESDVMQSVIAALEDVPNDAGFALIGRIDGVAGVDAGDDAEAAIEDLPEPPRARDAGMRGLDLRELERFLDEVPVGAKLGSRD